MRVQDIGLIAAVLVSFCLNCATPQSRINRNSPRKDTRVWNTALASGDLKVLMASNQVQTPIPQCSPQHNATSDQYAPSYFEEMNSCEVFLPPQLQTAREGKVDEKGDCNLGLADKTELVCHYHSSYEFASRDRFDKPENVLEVHCVTFYLDAEGKRTSKPLVYGMQLACAPGTFPPSQESHLVAESQSSEAKNCGTHFSQVYQSTRSCDLRCCRDGTLTNEKVDLKIRPSFAVCPVQSPEVDCSAILENMHAHTPHRPHDRVGAKYVGR